MYNHQYVFNINKLRVEKVNKTGRLNVQTQRDFRLILRYRV